MLRLIVIGCFVLVAAVGAWAWERPAPVMLRACRAYFEGRIHRYGDPEWQARSITAGNSNVVVQPDGLWRSTEAVLVPNAAGGRERRYAVCTQAPGGMHWVSTDLE